MTERTICEWCKAETTGGSVCPWSLVCAICDAKPGARCLRPSGHDAAEMHAVRYLTAERIDAANGITYPNTQGALSL